MKRLMLMVAAIALAAPLQAQTPFYQGKTIRLVVGSSAGSTYDIYARLIAQSLDKYIPGNPEIQVQNMPGGGSIIAANFLYNLSKPDGLTIGSINPAIYFNQLAGNKEVQFDWAKFIYLGSPDRSEDLLHIRADAPFKSIQDVRNAVTGPRCGATGTGTTGHYLPTLLNDALGTKFNVILGYPGGPEIDLAMERNEVQCRAFTIAAWQSGRTFEGWRKRNFINVLAQSGQKRDPRIVNVPTIFELMDEARTPDGTRRLASLVLNSNSFGRPYVVHPATPPELVKTLRDGFVKAMNDRELLEEAKRKNIDIELTSGDELAKLARSVIVSDQDVIERMKKLLAK